MQLWNQMETFILHKAKPIAGVKTYKNFKGDKSKSILKLNINF